MAGPNGLLTVREKVGYGFGDMASNLFWQMFSIYMAKFYTDVFMLGAATMGTMMLVTRMADAFIDPLIGAVADRTQTRWGHFRPYLLWLALPLAISGVLAFTTPSLTPAGKTVYAYVTLTLMMFLYSAINIPYSALMGVLSPNSADRTSAASFRFVMAFLPIFLIANATVPMAHYFGGSDNSPRGWQVVMGIYAVLAVILYLVTFAMTRERVQPQPSGAGGGVLGDVVDLLTNRPWVILGVVGIAALTCGNIRGTVLAYYFDHAVPDGKSYFGPVLTTGAIAFMAGAALAAPLSRKFGKRNFYMASMTLSAIATAAFYYVPPSNIALVWIGHAVISFVTAPTAPLIWSMYADSADYSEWKTGRRATGIVFSAASFSQKLGWALGGAGTGWLLGYYGYVAGTPLGPRTLHGIILMTSLIPAVAALISVVALFFYELDEPRVAATTAALEARRQAAAGTAPPAGATT